MELVIYLECIKKEKPLFRRVFKWRWEAELNRCKRICSPRPNRSAIPPVKWCVVYQKLFAPVNREVEQGVCTTTRLGNESLLCDEIILTQRGKGAEGQMRLKKTLCLCVSVIKLTQRHKGTEAQRQRVSLF